MCERKSSSDHNIYLRATFSSHGYSLVIYATSVLVTLFSSSYISDDMYKTVTNFHFTIHVNALNTTE